MITGTPIPDYRPMKYGEIIRTGDEKLGTIPIRGTRRYRRTWWAPVGRLETGRILTREYFLYRRPIPPVMVDEE
jgi:hypothetical protein